jgi:hypothetical protein
MFQTGYYGGVCFPVIFVKLDNKQNSTHIPLHVQLTLYLFIFFSNSDATNKFLPVEFDLQARDTLQF